MCWNATISLNTFIFSLATLGFVAYNNAYTKYKIAEFRESPWLYVFLMSIIGMQLVEYFLWNNLDNAAANRMWSIIGSLLVMTQPLTISLLIPDKAIQPVVTGAYAAFMALLIALKYPGHLDKYKTVEGSAGLSWKWYLTHPIEYVYYAVYWLVVGYSATFIPRYLAFAIFGVLAISVWNHGAGDSFTWGSKWCWGMNVLSFYYLYRIMLAMPFGDMMKTCKN